MKLSHTTLLAILASSALVSAAPTATYDHTSTINTMVKREDLNQVLEHLNELKTLRVKRDTIGDEDELALMELDKRADSVLGNLISALANSGLLSDVFNTLTTNDELKSSILSIVKATIQAALVQGPTLIKAIWNSGLLQSVFSKILNDSDLRSALLAAGKALFSTALNLVQNFLGSKTGSSSSSTASAAAKRDIDPLSFTVAEKREALVDGDMITERDLGDIVSFVIDQIQSSGLISNLILQIMSNPETTINFLTSALKNGLVLVEDIYGWAKDNGLLASGISWLQNSDNGIISTLGSFLAGSISSGDVSSDEFDNAGSATVTATTKATTTKAATAAATGAAAGTTTAAAVATGGSGDLGFLSKYAQEGATTLYKKRMLY